MKAVILSLILGVFLNMSSAGGRNWPIGSVVAAVIMGVWIKTSMDKHFEELKEQRKNDGGETPEEK